VSRVPEYEMIAGLYDYLMRHVDYQRWFDYLDRILSARFPHGGRLLEIACGTGIMLEKLSRAGWQAFGMDKSERMLEIARDRLESFDHEALLFAGDMRNFCLREQVDVVLCLYDSINYCLDEAELAATFRNVAAALRPGGLFIFDVVTRRNCRYHFYEFYERDTANGLDYIRKAYFDYATSVQTNSFIVCQSDNPDERFEEEHHQKIYRLQTLKKILQSGTGLGLVGVYDGFSRRPGNERSNRVHFIAEKNENHSL